MSAPSPGSAPIATPLRAAVLVLSWNARDDVLACLSSLESELTAADQLYLVDNASHDDTVRAVSERHRTATVISNRENLGFSGGMNVGLRAALAHDFEFVFILNQDTVLAPGTLAALVAAARRFPQVGAFQPLLLRLADHDMIDSAAVRLHRVPGATDWMAGEPISTAPREEIEIFGACGAATLYRAATLRVVGYFDEDLFVMFEDVDLAIRMRLAGHRAMLIPRARVLHRRGISRAGQKPTPLRQFLVARNMTALALRNWPMRWLVLSLPFLLFRAFRALRLRGTVKRECGPLWSKAWAERGAARANAKRFGFDRWLTTKWLPIRENRGAD